MGFLRFLIDNRLFLLAGVLLSFTSSYGQTYFISIFAADIMRDFGLSNGQWGGIYTAGTTLSALVMVQAGVLTDRFRVRGLSAFVAVGLALACLAMAVVPGAALLVGVIFALRFFGQGMMSTLAIVAMARWFVGARGRALSVASMGFNIGQAVLPILFVALLARYDWRLLWVIAAGLVLLTIPAFNVLLRQERSPRSMASDSVALGMEGRHWTRGQAVRHPLFWLMMPALIGPPAWGTALFFQQVHLATVKGWALGQFVALYPLFTVASVAATFAAGAAIDRFGTWRIVPVYLVPYVVSFLIIGWFPSIGMAAVGLVIFALGTGMQATLPGAFWAEYYGTQHLGAIKAVAVAIMVFGSAIGPGISGVLIDLGVDFPVQMIGYAVYFVLAGVMATIGVLRYRRRR